MGTTIVGAVNVLATYAVLLLMDRCGRRTLILWSSGVMFLSCCLICAALLGYFGNIVALLAVNIYVIFFEFGYVSPCCQFDWTERHLLIMHPSILPQAGTHPVADCSRNVLGQIRGCCYGCFVADELGM